MTILLILEKIAIVAVYASIIVMVLRFRKTDKTAKLEFDLISRLELCAGAGIALVSLVSVIDPSTYVFTACLCLLSILLALFEKNRIILAGDKMMLVKGKTYKTKDTASVETGMFTLKLRVRTSPDPLSIYVPLTSNRVLRECILPHVKKK